MISELNNKILQEKVQEIFDKVLSEETSKVKRDQYNQIQFKLDDLCNSIGESIKEVRKIERSLPDGLKTLCNGRLTTIEKNLLENEKLISQMKDKLKKHKKKTYTKKTESN